MIPIIPKSYRGANPAIGCLDHATTIDGGCINDDLGQGKRVTLKIMGSFCVDYIVALQII